MPASIYPLSSTDQVVVYESGLAIMRHQTPFHPGRWSIYATCRPDDTSPWTWNSAAWRNRPQPLALDAFERNLR